jgi:hypothetical protein
MTAGSISGQKGLEMMGGSAWVAGGALMIMVWPR